MTSRLNSNLLFETCETLWYDSASSFKLPLPDYNKKQQRTHERQLNQLLSELIDYLNTFPEDEHQQETWIATFCQSYHNFTLPQYLSSFKSLNKKTLSQFIQQTDYFFKSSKKFDEQLSILDQVQAIRNQWIILILQCLMNQPLNQSPAILAYSLLYPYTDNLIDDPMLSTQEKESFNTRLIQRLKGTYPLPVLATEEKVYRLIDMIEQTFPRNQFPDVYEALLLIQQGQIDSITQQIKGIIPYEQNILKISINKGGASVLVDGYLITGDLTYEQQFFTYGYGFLLQLCDDLQDINQDLDQSHQTVFTQLANHYPLDPLTNKLIHFCQTLLHSYLIDSSDSDENFKTLIETNCLYLILFAIAEHPQYFSQSYLKQIKPYLPFSFSYIQTFKRRFKRQTQKLKPSYHGVPTIDIILKLGAKLLKEEII